MMQPCIVSLRNVAVQHDVFSEHLQIGDCVTGRRHVVTTLSLAQDTVVCVIWTAGLMS